MYIKTYLRFNFSPVWYELYGEFFLSADSDVVRFLLVTEFWSRRGQGGMTTSPYILIGNYIYQLVILLVWFCCKEVAQVFDKLKIL